MTGIVIADKVIRLSDSLYCLNDLHKASGGEKRYEPHQWLRLAQTAELIKELESEVQICTSGDMQICISPEPQIWGSAEPQISGSVKNQRIIKTVKGFGKQQGTYACRELVYSYAMWISPKFHLQVVRAFDAMVSGGVGTRPALLPLRPPRNYEEACALADETLREVNEMNRRLAKIEPWMRYWRDVFVEEACKV